MNEPMLEGKSHVIPKQVVWDAWLKVKENGGAAGADGVPMGQFEERVKDNLYKLWNRVSVLNRGVARNSSSALYPAGLIVTIGYGALATFRDRRRCWLWRPRRAGLAITPARVFSFYPGSRPLFSGVFVLDPAGFHYRYCGSW